ncbi:uncharacterized protein, partial [Solanum tuberosum]|uniref:uncharacterized protein n=1 Tax=Solanum tuberosum TaxID=4113 RepID=UPI00073A2797
MVPETSNHVYALSRKSFESISLRHLPLLLELRALNICFTLDSNGSVIANLQVKPILFEQVKEAQKIDETLVKLTREVQNGEKLDFTLTEDGVLFYQNRLCIPNDDNLIRKLLNEAHTSPYTMHPGGTKMYQTIKNIIGWEMGIKRDIAEFISKCLVCQHLKAEHQVLVGLLQPLSIREWKWERITMDFVFGLPRTQRNHDAIWVIVDRLTKNAHFLAIRMDYSLEHLAELYINEIFEVRDEHLALIEFAYNNSCQSSIGMPPYGALYGRKCRTPLCWSEAGERKLVGPEIVQQTEDKVSPRKKIIRFGQKGKLSLRFILPYEILERVGPVACKLALPPKLEKIHNLFHVSMLRRYRSDPSHVLPVESIEVNPDLTYNGELIRIEAREVKQLRKNRIPLVK